MARKILILGASYGSLLGAKLIMAGHDVTLVCREGTADLINAKGVDVRIKLKGEADHRAILSGDQPGRIDAVTPDTADPTGYDLVALAMQEPQYAASEIRALMSRIAMAGTPCLSIMNMPPLSYLRRIKGLDTAALEPAYTDARIWDQFNPDLVSLCSPDPQAFRPPEEANNVLHVGLPSNFKAAVFENRAHTRMLEDLARDIDAVRLDGEEVPVKLRVHKSLYAPLAKWAMLMTGNYRCVTPGGVCSIADAVHAYLEIPRDVYNHVNALVTLLGARQQDLVPYEKYANAAQSLVKPSSAARAIAAGATEIERVDRLVQLLCRQFGMRHPTVDSVVRIVDARLTLNREAAAAPRSTRCAA